MEKEDPINWANSYIVNETLHDTSTDIIRLYFQLSSAYKDDPRSTEWYDAGRKWVKYKYDLGDLVLPTNESAKKEMEMIETEYQKIADLDEKMTGIRDRRLIKYS